MLSRLVILLAFVTYAQQSFATHPEKGFYCYYDSSPQYRAVWKAHNQKINPTPEERMQFRSTVYDFAIKGEPAAVETVLVFEEKPDRQIGMLLELVKQNPENLQAMLHLGRLFSNANDKRCLQIFERIAVLGQEIKDLDYWPNHVSAILRFAEKSEASLRQCWGLLKAWKYEPDNDSDITALHTHYFQITQRAAQMNLKILLGDLVTWDTKTHQHPTISDAIMKALEATPYLPKGKQRVDSFNFPDKETIERILAEVDLYMEAEGKRRVDARETTKMAEEIISKNVSVLLEQDDIKGIPTSKEHEKKFAGFNPENPSLDHLSMWARILLDKKRTQLIAYDGNDYGVIKYFSEVDNKTLLPICLAELASRYEKE